MKNIPLLSLAIFCCLATNSFCQNSNIDFGIKAGANYSKYTPDLVVHGILFTQFKRKAGFYVGGFLNMEISEKVQFQPELLFALQGTNTLIEDTEVNLGFEGPVLVDFESRINESTLVVPIVFRYLFTGAFFLETGPQLGYIISRDEKITKAGLPLPGEREEREFEYDKFDLGLTMGAGYNLSKSLSLNGRFFLGLIDRDNNLRSSVFNLGLEYKL